MYPEQRTPDERFASAFTYAAIGMAIVSPAGRLLEVNPALCTLIGYTADELLALTFQEITHPDDLAQDLAYVQQLLAGAIDTYQMEKRYRHKLGHAVWVLLSVSLLRDEDGSPRYFISQIQDITERKALEALLEARVRERTAEVQFLYDNTPVGYHSLDAAGCILLINQKELDWLGYTRAEVIGRPMTDFLTPPAQAVFRQVFPAFRQQGSMYDVEVDLVRRDGTTFPVIINATAIYDDAGHYVRSRSTMVDITERRRAEEMVRRANGELARALRMKDEFLANMSHELRTPLHGILTIAELLLDEIYGPLTERQQRSLRRLGESGHHLLAIVNDLLDLSKIEAGKLELQLDPLVVDDVCQASLHLVRELAVKKQIALAYVPAPAGAKMCADGTRLKQMLGNLLGNAIKFTPPGGRVGLSVSVDAAAGVIHFAVQDTGPGIAPADQGRLFQPFTQLDATLSRPYEGTGLGLVLVKRLAEQHGGTVRVESAGIPGEGCCFTISLPYPDPAPF